MHIFIYVCLCVCAIVCNQRMSVEWGRKQERLTAVLFPGLNFQQRPWPRPVLVRGSQKRLNCNCFVLRRVTAFQFHGYSLCPFWSPIPSIFLCKAVSFSMIESILRLIVSVSMLTTLPTASNIMGCLVRLWTAVPVF